MECVWKYRVVKRKAMDRQPQMKMLDNGQQVQDVDENGMPAYQDVPIDLQDVYNAVQWKALDLRNFYTIPAAAVSVQDARAVVKIEYLYESDCQELINEGILDKDEVELALAMVPNGATELASSEQPTETYTAGHQINLGSGQGTQSTKFFKNRGPIEVHRVHSNQYDLDGDGVAEENIFWWHRSTKRLLGWMRYEYFSGLRPFFTFSPFPRFGRLYGFSLMERLQGLQQAEDSLTNQRIDDGDLRLGGVWLYLEGAIDKDSLEFGPAGYNEVDASATQGDVTKAVAKVNLGEMPEYSFLETDRFNQAAEKFTGLNSPALGGQSQGRRSAQEAKQWQASAATRTGLLAMRYRMAIEPLINFTHDLNKQYLSTDQQFSVNGEQYKLPAEVLKQDYNIDISGASDPIDANTRKGETLQAVFEFMQVPLIAQNPMHQFYLLRKAVQAMGWEVDEDKIIGTEQELQEQMQQQQAAQQAAALMGGQQDNQAGASNKAGDGKPQAAGQPAGGPSGDAGVAGLAGLGQ
jgi:ribosomal protein L12E/L44/L45/RPP1/RPP2